MRKQWVLKIALILLLAGIIIPGYSYGEIIFEDDFDKFTSGWSPSIIGGCLMSGGTLANPGRNEPQGWTGYIYYDKNQIMDIQTDCGRSNTPCLRIGPRFNVGAWDQVGLVKFLGDQGYNELYIRYYFKLDDGFQFGDGTNGSWVYWKHGRIWQNLNSSDIVNNISEICKEPGKGAIVWGLYDNAYADFNPFFTGFFLKNATEGTNDCVDCGKMRYYPWDPNKNGGHITPHIGMLDSKGKVPSGQTWHCFEFHFKLADSWGGPGGLFEIWVDGIKQRNPTNTVNCITMPTAKLGTGMNLIILHDNGNLSTEWTSQHYIYIDDVVVSTSYIGPGYVIGNCDINSDGVVTVLDVQLCVNVVLGIEAREEIVNKARQVTAPPGECNVLDIQAVVNVILNSV